MQIQVLKGAFRKKKEKSLTVDLKIASIYCHVGKSEYEVILNFVETKVSREHTKNHVIIGQDSNSKLGMDSPVEINGPQTHLSVTLVTQSTT